MVSLLVTPPLLKPQGWNVPGGFAAARKAPIVAADSENDLPVFSMPECASRHDMRSFLHTFFALKSHLPEFHIEKLLLDSAHDAYPLYEYCKTNGITLFIDRNPGHTGHFKYKDDVTIAEDATPSVSWNSV